MSNSQRGHATALEQAVIEDLEAGYRDSYSIGQALDLAQLYIEPLHEEDRAIELLKQVLDQDSGNARAKFWLAHCKIWYELDDDAIRQGVTLLRSLDDSEQPWSAAARELHAGALEWLAPEDIEARILLLQDSVRLAPDWVTNRRVLAENYLLVHRSEEAVAELTCALRNLAHRPAVLSIVDEYFHASVTGLLEDSSDIMSRLSELTST